MTPALASQTAAYIAGFEGFIATAAWDVNAWRIGYGSDTIGVGPAIPVKRGDTTTREEAQANLAARIPQYEAVIVKQVGATAWNSLPDNTKIALLDFAYNYGSLTPTLAARVADHLSAIADAVHARSVDNGGENAKRRISEAGLIAKG